MMMCMHIAVTPTKYLQCTISEYTMQNDTTTMQRTADTRARPCSASRNFQQAGWAANERCEGKRVPCRRHATRELSGREKRSNFCVGQLEFRAGNYTLCPLGPLVSRGATPILSCALLCSSLGRWSHGGGVMIPSPARRQSSSSSRGWELYRA